MANKNRLSRERRYNPDCFLYETAASHPCLSQVITVIPIQAVCWLWLFVSRQIKTGAKKSPLQWRDRVGVEPTSLLSS